MEQRTAEWFEARKGKLTGSNIGAALGLNPWKTPEALIRQMVREHHGAESEFTGNIATEYGTLHEPLAIMEYLGKTANHVEECGFFVHHEYEWLGASPDGLIDDDGMIEVKCPFGLRIKKDPDFKLLAEQPHYFAQVQIEMACADRQWCDFYQWAKHGDALERIEFSQEWFDDNLPALMAFYSWYKKEIDNPEHLEPLEKEINTLSAKSLIDEYDRVSAALDDAKARKDELLKELISLAGERNAIIHGRKLTKVERKGNVDYSKIPELKGVKLDQYRKKSSEYWKFS